MTIGVWQRCSMLAASLAFAVFGMSVPAAADTVWGVTSTGDLISFDSATPGTITTVAITGLQGGETLLGIDQRPATGQLYGLGSTSRLYVINPTTGVATAVNATPFAALDGTSFGFDFNRSSTRSAWSATTSRTSGSIPTLARSLVLAIRR